MGALAFNRPVAELIEAASLCEEDIELTFQGENQLAAEPARLIKLFGVEDRVRILPACPVDAIVEVAREFDVGIVALAGVNENERRAETTKVYTYMAAGLALLGSDLPGIRSVVEKTASGRLVSGLQPRAWALAMDEVARMNRGELMEMKRRSIDAATRVRPSMQTHDLIAEFARALGRRGEEERAGAEDPPRAFSVTRGAGGSTDYTETRSVQN